MPSEISANTQTVTTTEHSLFTDTSFDSGDLQTTDQNVYLFLDCNNLAIGDFVRVTCYEKVGSGSTHREVWRALLAGPRKTFVSPPLPLLHGYDITVVKTGGTDRAMDWSLRAP